MTIQAYKELLPNDIQRAATKLHESIPLTGTIVSGTYSDNNIKNYSHGMFQSVYDYPYLSSSANHIFDMSLGFTADAGINNSANLSQQNKKKDMYNELAQVLCGYSSTGSIFKFDHSGSFGSEAAATTMKEVIVLNFARLLTKDEIQTKTNGGFKINLGVQQTYANPFAKMLYITDGTGSTGTVKTNSPAGEYQTLYASSGSRANQACGLVFYQAGIAILTSSVFTSAFNGFTDCIMQGSGKKIGELMASGTIEKNCDAIRRRIESISFTNTTELNSTIYFCRAGASEFNYSSNPTYLTASKLRVKNVSTDDPVSYITTVGLYGSDNTLLAVGKMSEPLKKTPSNEYTLRVRLDY